MDNKDLVKVKKLITLWNQEEWWNPASLSDQVKAMLSQVDKRPPRCKQMQPIIIEIENLLTDCLTRHLQTKEWNSSEVPMIMAKLFAPITGKATWGEIEKMDTFAYSLMLQTLNEAKRILNDYISAPVKSVSKTKIMKTGQKAKNIVLNQQK
ncbi:MAG: hypothetical protein F6K55_03165 [Moorea sp. SIO4A3]|nr:hypothetical protein [Moorena sp. SIO4A3]